MLLPVDILVAEEDDQMFHQRLVDFREGLVAERLAQVDAGNLRPQHRADRVHRDRFIGHVAVSPVTMQVIMRGKR